MRGVSLVGIFDMDIGEEDSWRCVPIFDVEAVLLAGARNSVNVFHSPHDGQRPIHFGLSYPHSPHTYTILSFAILFSSVVSVGGAPL